MNFMPLFPQLHSAYLIASTLRSLEVLFFKNFRGLNKSRDSFVKRQTVLLFHVFLCVFEPVHTKKMSQLSLQNCLLEIPGLVIVQLFEPFNARK